MPDASPSKFDKLLAKLRELFELDKSDLDFGIYRILRARRDEIDSFLARDLLAQVRQELGVVTADKLDRFAARVEEEIEKVCTYGGKTRAEAATSEPVLRAKRDLEAARNPEALEDEVYSLLTTFFSRYYDSGDFVSMRRYSGPGRERYMIPYNGEEVKLVWANMDQYYVKSSENFRDYAFRAPALAPGQSLPDPDTRLRVVFKLVAADTEKDNVKASDDARRCFILASQSDHPIHWSEEAGAKCLVIPFEYRPLTHADWADLPELLKDRKYGAQGAAAKPLHTVICEKRDAKKDGKPTLVPPNQEQAGWISGARIVEAAAALGAEAKPVLEKAPTENAPWRTLAEKHLWAYVGKNSVDYFIHKDLGGFLTRELDYYLKSEVLRVDDLLSEDEAARTLTLKKARAFRHVAAKLITFLHRLEQFQKKLWLKKKFVVETRYCITLDRVPEALYPEICACDAQWQEWEELHAISELAPSSDPGKASGELFDLAPTPPLKAPAFLKANPHLSLDTRHFSRDFTTRLLASIDDLDASLDGVCFHSENFQALQLMQERFREQVKCVYIDPPYNRGGNDFAYKDSFKSSSWISMIADRLSTARNLLERLGVLFASIDENEQLTLATTLGQIFGTHNRIEEMIWAQNTTHSQSPTYSTNHEYVEVFAKSRGDAELDPTLFREPKPGYFEISELVSQLNPEYPPIAEVEAAIKALMKRHVEEFKQELADAELEYNEETKKQDPWRGIYNYNCAEYRDKHGHLISEEEAKQKHAHLVVWRESDPSAPAGKQSPTIRDPEHENFRFYEPIHPLTQKRCPHPKSGWRFPMHPTGKDRSSFTLLQEQNRIVWGDDEAKVPQFKRFLHEVETNVAKSVFHDYTDGEKQVAGLFGVTGLFASPKPTTLVERFAIQTTVANSIVLDFFAGSGTTGHAVINLNREDVKNAEDSEPATRRKYLLVEMGGHFETVLVPRLKKVVYASDWKDGKPVARDTGISHGFKIVRLESYEDTLNNLELARTREQEDLLSSHPTLREDYLLGYFLDVETRGSVLRVDRFANPWGYQLKIASGSAGETRDTTVDLVETFHWLIGMNVQRVSDIEHHRPEKGFATDEHGRLQLAGKHLRAAEPGSPEGCWSFQTTDGTLRGGEKALVIWRSLTVPADGQDPADALERDNLMLEAYLSRMDINPRSKHWDILYVNGDHTLENLAEKMNATATEGESAVTFKVRVIESEFHRLMFLGTGE